MSDPKSAISTGVGATLVADSGLATAMGTATSGRVRDVSLPEGARGSVGYPFVFIGGIALADLENACRRDIEALFDIHIWCQSSSWAQSRAMSWAVREALYRNYDVAGWKVAVSACEGEREINDPDSSIQHIILNFRLLIEPE